MISVLTRVYTSEELCDLSRDVEEALDPGHNPIMENVPTGEHGFHHGSFRVTIEWQSDDEIS